MTDDSHSCPSCGAHVPADSDHCDLCGTPVDSDDPVSDSSPEADPPSGAEEPPADPGADSEPDQEGEHVYCTQCGARNPGDANYCSQCGTELRTPSTPAGPDGTRAVQANLPNGSPSSSEGESGSSDAPEPESDEQGEMGTQILWMVGIGLFFVLGFFFVSQWSAQYDWGEDGGSSAPAAQAEDPSGAGASPAGGQGQGAGTGMPSASGAEQPETDLSTLVEELGSDVDGPVADEIDSLRSELDDAESGQRDGLRAELVRMYIGAGAPGRAALLQRELADATGSVDDRRRAANLLYRWMRQVEQQGDRDRIAEVARHVATAYQAVVDEQPEDHDARTRMGEAFLLTSNPMRGIEAINAVLEDDSTFVPARFQKGLALLQINRLDEALQQFELVQTHADPEEPFYKQAERAIEVINEQRGGGEAGSSSPE